MYVCVCVCFGEEGIWNKSGCQGKEVHGILHRLASQGAMGALVLGKSPVEVKSAVIEMKGGFPPPSDLGEKNEKGRWIWEVSEGESFTECKIALTVFHDNMSHIWNPY